MFWHRILIIVLGVAVFGTSVPGVATGQGLEFIKSHYTKYEYRIPMRDGSKLFTSVYVPKDDSTTYPVLLKRTPYGLRPYGVDQYPENLGPSTLLGEAGYIFVYQDAPDRIARKVNAGMENTSHPSN